MAQGFVGKYKLESSENFDEYLKTIGVGFALRKVAGTLKPDVQIEINGDEWTLSSFSSFKNSTLKFKLDQEFEETTPDGRTVKTVFVLDEQNRLVQKQTPLKDSDKYTEIIRFIKDGDLHIEMICGDIRATRLYKKE